MWLEEPKQIEQYHDINRQMESKRKNLLIVTCGFPPAGGMGVHRITKFVKYLSRRNWSIFVLTVHITKYGRKDYSLEKDIPTATKVYRTNNLYTSQEPNKFSRIRFLFDYYFKWYPKAIIAGSKLITKNDINLIFASYPWASHIVIGYMLSMISHCHLVIDYRDCWDKRFPLLSLFLNGLERKIIKKSNHVVFNNFHTSESYRGKYKAVLTSKYSLIENCYDNEDDFSTPRDRQQIFNIVYAGNSYHKRIQRPFLTGIKELAGEGKLDKRDFKVTFVGYGDNIDKEYIFRNRIEAFFRFTDDVTHAESVKIQMTSNLLLLFANFGPSVSSWCTPGKFFEYLGTGKPILLLAQKGSAMADYLEWTKSGVLVDPADLDGLKNVITDFYSNWKNGKALSTDGTPQMQRDDFNADFLTNKLDDVFRKVIG